MRKLFILFSVITVGLGIAGCARVTTQVVDKPRVDQELQQGNRGFLFGSAPKEARPRKTTRKIVEANVELPTRDEMNAAMGAKKPTEDSAAPAPQAAARALAPAPAPVRVERAAPIEEDLDVEIQPAPAQATRKTIGPGTYTVVAGDNLEKIAGKVYGRSSKWRQIFDANRDKLKSPNNIYVGQKLVIPALAGNRSESDVK